MNANALAKKYHLLTPDERFRLVVAAAARGDQAEQDRLAEAGERITLTARDHTPYAAAFHDLGTLMLLELLDEAARYLDAIDRAWDKGERDGEDSNDADAEEGDRAVETPDTNTNAVRVEDDAGACPLWRRYLDVALAAGFTLRAKADGWKLFCERLSLPSFAPWETLPGFDRLQRALALAEQGVFAPEGMVAWLNRIRPAGGREATEATLMSAEKIAAELDVLFRRLVEHWGG
jgi:hypothetical protein